MTTPLTTIGEALKGLPGSFDGQYEDALTALDLLSELVRAAQAVRPQYRTLEARTTAFRDLTEALLPFETSTEEEK